MAPVHSVALSLQIRESMGSGPFGVLRLQVMEFRQHATWGTWNGTLWCGEQAGFCPIVYIVASWLDIQQKLFIIWSAKHNVTPMR